MPTHLHGSCRVVRNAPRPAWQLGGTTDIDCLTLLCGWHHREFVRRGWSVRMINGVPWWTPPKWIDPDQIPRRNQVHHLDRIAIDEFRDTERDQRVRGPTGSG